MNAKQRVTFTEETTTTVVKITYAHDFLCPECGFEANADSILENKHKVVVYETRRSTQDKPRVAGTSRLALK